MAETSAPEAPPVRRRALWRRAASSPRAAPFPGPILIIASVLAVTFGFWLLGRLTDQHVDILAFWLPRWCFLGSTVASGHVPVWLPNQFGGVPMAADPQSGWLYAPVMFLFSTLSCSSALEWFITIQPILAGLGMYAFLRAEGTGRPAATVGGLTLALSIAGSRTLISLPFSGSLAWTALTLAAAARFVRAVSGSSRVGWLAATAACWSQLAAAHMTDGLLTGSLVVGLYVIARLIADLRDAPRGGRAGHAAAVVVPLVVALPVLSWAILWPHLELIHRTSIGLGYVTLTKLASQLSGTRATPPFALHGEGVWWGTSFARGPGGYVGVLAIILIPVAFANRRWRLPACAFALAGFIGFAANLDRLIAARPVRQLAFHYGSLAELWLRDPYRFRYLLPVALAALAGYGLQAWLNMGATADGRQTRRRLLAWFGPPVVVFGLLPIAAGSNALLYITLAIGLAWAIPLLALAARGRRWPRAALPLIAAVELTLVGVVQQFGPQSGTFVSPSQTHRDPGLGTAFSRLDLPRVDPAAYLAPGPIIDAIRAGPPDERYLSFDRRLALTDPRGFLVHQQKPWWPALANGRSVLFGLNEIQGYSPVQLVPYWKLVRKVNPIPIFYNSATFQRAPPSLLRLFAVGWIIQPAGQAPLPGTSFATRQGTWRLYRVNTPQPMASFVGRWRITSPQKALDQVVSPGFDPATEAILQARPTGATRATGPPRPPAATASYHQLGPAQAEVKVTSNGGLVVVRIPYDRGWHATLDGRPVPVQPADYVMQAVAVPAGTHTIVLSYSDPSLKQGIVVSLIGWLIMLGAWLLLRRRESRGA